MQTLKSVAVGILFLGSTAGAATVERALFGSGSASGSASSEATRATCSCKGQGDCTCAKGQCKCKNCGQSNRGNQGNKAKVFEALKGSNETTKLPDTARLDARGGVFI